MSRAAMNKRFRRHERGAILVTSLLLLMILTVLGLAVMRMANLQERMAGNTRDVNLALQGAEAALRDGEAKLRLLAGKPLLGTDAGCEYCDQGVLPVDIEIDSAFDWNANSTAMGGTAIDELHETPRYTIEREGFSPDEDNLGHDYVIPGRDVFTVTARSTGASGQANTVLQSTFARRF